MWRAGYYIFYGINRIITLLPLGILYVFSDILFLFLYYYPSYRRQIVAENLTRSFPEKSAEEIRQIEKAFYRHLSDLFIEVLKLPGMSKKELLRRVKLNNPELIKPFYESGKDIALVYSHYNNWEWLTTVFPLFTAYKCVGAYKPVKNKIVNNSSTIKEPDTRLTRLRCRWCSGGSLKTEKRGSGLCMDSFPIRLLPGH